VVGQDVEAAATPEGGVEEDTEEGGGSGRNKGVGGSDGEDDGQQRLHV